jgi:O-antigen chain-terminating methyltransferase
MLKKAIGQTKTVGRIRNLKRTINGIKSTVERIDEKLDQRDDRLERLRLAYGKVEPYQPLYGVTGLGEPQRESKDRGEAILSYFENSVAGMRFLDIGCYFGYLSFYLADRGAKATGWDYWDTNIEVCNRLKDINGLNADFSLETFSPESIEKIQKNEYDVALIFSVLHWTVHEKGLEYVQDALKKLMDRIPVLVVELAQKGEGKDYFWDKAAPARDLDIFNKVEDINIEKIGEFPTHLSEVKRPIYVISKKHVNINKRKYLIDKVSSKAYKGAPSWRDISSKYYLSGDFFIKESFFEDSLSMPAVRAVNEINFMLQKERNHLDGVASIPKLIDYELTDKGARLVLERAKGKLLSDIDKEAAGVELAEKVSISLVNVLAELEKNGLHHNDIRSWNTIVGNKGNVTLIDYELVATRAEEDEAISLLWTINTALAGEREDTSRQKTKFPERKYFTSATLRKIYDGAKNGKNFVQIADSLLVGNAKKL